MNEENQKQIRKKHSLEFKDQVLARAEKMVLRKLPKILELKNQ